MAKTPEDLALLLDVLLDVPYIKSFTHHLGAPWSDFSIGALDYKKWWHDAAFLRPVEEATTHMVRTHQRVAGSAFDIC